MKVLLTKRFFESDIQYIEERLDEGIEIVHPNNFDISTIASCVKGVDVLLGGVFTEEILAAGDSLKLIQIPWTGVDSLDFTLLRKHNVDIANSHSNALVVAEHAVSMMLDAAKRMSFHDRGMRLGEWNRVKKDGSNKVSPFSKMVSNSNVAIVGYGSIGKQIHKLLRGFSCNFSVFNRHKYSGHRDKEVSYYTNHDLEARVSEFDYVFITVPLTHDTRHFFNEKIFSEMDADAVLINISRGEVIDEDALYNSLKNRDIGFAAVDTWYNYPSGDKPIAYPSLKNDFHTLDNLVLSPHRAGYIDSGFVHLNDAIENLNRLNLGKPLINLISLDNTY